MSKREIVTFAIGKPKTLPYGNGKEIVTGICKDKVEEAFLSKGGFNGDGVADLHFHGGPDRAVCVYPFEHYAQWETEFHQPLPDATFGENLTVSNMLETDVFIGDIYRIGDAVIQVTQGRVPCSTISKRTGLPNIMKRMIETGYTGYLCRVLEEGTVRRDATISLIEQHPAKISILFGNEVYFHQLQNIEAMKRLAEVEALADEWRKSLHKRMARLEGMKDGSTDV
ncbi:MOSC domain-containing protein [Sporosarcina sp. 179-K 3D1 HS]|uniref:MOSC domain-containing protein n=1 Tax=Sporosarcina sp. 179-K 3D1 HS TaxID=3232169 RepID=UPI00399FA10D